MEEERGRERGRGGGLALVKLLNAVARGRSWCFGRSEGRRRKSVNAVVQRERGRERSDTAMPPTRVANKCFTKLGG